MQEQNNRTRKYVLASLILHGSLFLAMVLSNLILPRKRELVTPTVQIDMVALPNQVKDTDAPPVDVSLPVKDNSPEEPERKEEARAETEPDPVALEKPQKSAKKDPPKRDSSKAAKSALERLREEMREREEEERKKKQALVDARKKDLERFSQATRNAIRGNQVNQGTSATGSLEATLNAYAGHVADRIRSNWGLPTWLQGKGLNASVIIYINSSGGLVSYRFVKFSGNETFDTYVKSAIQRSVPFAPPPAEMANGLRSSGLEVGFPL